MVMADAAISPLRPVESKIEKGLLARIRRGEAKLGVGFMELSFQASWNRHDVRSGNDEARVIVGVRCCSPAGAQCSASSLHVLEGRDKDLPRKGLQVLFACTFESASILRRYRQVFVLRC